MKVSILSTIFSLAALCSFAGASVSLSSFPQTVHIGQTYTLSWTATTNYTYTLWLILEKPGGNRYSWTKVQGLAEGLKFNTLAGSYHWTVPSNMSTSRNYAIWMDAFDIPFDGGNFDTQTAYFNVSASSSPTTSASATPSATHSVSSSRTATATGTPISSHHSGLSGGAIAGIVIAILGAVALLVGAGLFMAKYRRRSAFKKREAEARANRLSGVMPAGSSAYEMHDKGPAAKETSV